MTADIGEKPRNADLAADRSFAAAYKQHADEVLFEKARSNFRQY